jgi:hypothetical protein
MTHTARIVGLFSLCCALGLPSLTLAQTSATAPNKPSVKQAVPAAKAAVKKPVVKKTSSSSFVPQSEAIKTLAEQFKGGRFNCEFNNYLTITPNPSHPGYLTLTHKGTVANMLPVPTNTGALRLEGKTSGLVWLQLPTKSMLMNSKIGQRLADDCHAAN